MNNFSESFRPWYVNQITNSYYAKINLRIMPTIPENENEIFDFIVHKSKDLKEIVFVFNKR